MRRRRKEATGLPVSSYKGSSPTPERHSPDLTTAHRPHLLIPPPWRLEFQQRNFEGPKHSVHCKNLQWLPSSLGQRPQFLTKPKTFHGPVPSPAAPLLSAFLQQEGPSSVPHWERSVPSACNSARSPSVWSPLPPRLRAHPPTVILQVPTRRAARGFLPDPVSHCKTFHSRLTFVALATV